MADDREVRPPRMPATPGDRAWIEHDDRVAAEHTAYVRARAAGEVEGVFGPRSVVWTVYRETAQLWSGVRALLLEIAHPAVAAGVDQHSSFSRRYMGRLIRTFGMPYQMVFGDLTTALRIASNIHHRHHTIRGTIASETASPVAGQAYRANDPAFLFWVQATLLDTGLRVFETLVRPLDPDERTQFYDEHKLFSAMMGIPSEYVPPTMDAFDAYFRDMLEGPTLEVGGTAKRVWQLISHAPAPIAMLSNVSTLISCRMLPPKLREGFGIPWTDREERAHARAVAVLRRATRNMPPVVRYNPVYLDALTRIARARGERPSAQARLGGFVGRVTGLAAAG